jgi:hypothetical protein
MSKQSPRHPDLPVYRVVQIDNGWIVTKAHTPLRYFRAERDAREFAESTAALFKPCPATGEPCPHLGTAESPDGAIMILTCDMTGHEVDRYSCPLDDPNPRMPL